MKRIGDEKEMKRRGEKMKNIKGMVKGIENMN